MKIYLDLDFSELTEVSLSKTPAELESLGQLKYQFHSSNPINDKLMRDMNMIYTLMLSANIYLKNIHIHSYFSSQQYHGKTSDMSRQHSNKESIIKNVSLPNKLTLVEKLPNQCLQKGRTLAPNIIDIFFCMKIIIKDLPQIYVLIYC